MVNAMLVSSNLRNNLWGEALLTACHVYNTIPSKKFKVSPYELWNGGRKSNLKYGECNAFQGFPKEFDDFCANEGIIHQPTAPYSPQQNGLAKRKNQSLVEMVNAMSKLGPKGIRRVFVGYAENSKAYILLNLETFKIVESIQVEFFEDKFKDDHVPIDVGQVRQKEMT
ncbi:hypothetical protein LIER_04506 [Lithospermum erythrorhizon]|uniref:Integrase catalytic domain-containing protein n=1 Tax=Lithospermum erythrorhizon TaxID=34254 RepID=A0AAV3NYB5_LITER